MIESPYLQHYDHTAYQDDENYTLRLFRCLDTIHFPFAVQKVQKLNSQGGLSFESTVL